MLKEYFKCLYFIKVGESKKKEIIWIAEFIQTSKIKPRRYKRSKQTHKISLHGQTDSEKKSTRLWKKIHR